MMNSKKIEELILSTFVADAYCLGTHWVYDEKQLKTPSINWEELNNPLAIWHKGKSAGEFTHYGDQSYWLYEYLKENDSFNKDEFFKLWLEKMNSYEGYIDGATRNTLENYESGINPAGSDSTDLSVVGRSTPLLKVSKTKEEFLKNVKDLVCLTHNSYEALSTSEFFAKLLWSLLENNNDMEETILSLKNDFDTKIQEYIRKGIDSKNNDTFETIREFGPACAISEGFSGIIHLLCKYKDPKEMLIQNSKAGGDTSARAMITTALMMTKSNITNLPKSWFKLKNNF